MYYVINEKLKLASLRVCLIYVAHIIYVCTYVHIYNMYSLIKVELLCCNAYKCTRATHTNILIKVQCICINVCRHI